MGGDTVDLGTLLLNLALLALVGYLIARPLLKQSRPQPEHNDPAAGLAAERERLLAALRDLELDQATGKISAEDYAQQRPQLVAQGAAVLRQIDEAATRPSARRATRPTAALDDEIEAAVQQLRQGRRQPRGSQPAAAACPACGQATRAQDRFCPGCGAPLAKAARRPKTEAVR